MRLAIGLLMLLLVNISWSQDAGESFHPAIPKAWDDAEIASLEVPLADPAGSPKHVTAEYYYQIPVRPIYKLYPVYAPGREPAGYMDWLKKQEPVIVWGNERDKMHRPVLKTKADWIAAGEIAFSAPIAFDLPLGLSPVEDVRDPAWYAATHSPVDERGILPFYQYVVRKKGQVELGSFSCAMCHTRVMPDGKTIKGAQGNFPFDSVEAYSLRQRRFKLDDVRAFERSTFAAPWLRAGPQTLLDGMSISQIVAMHEGIPPGVLARHRSSPLCPPHIPSLIGVEKRRYLDASGLQQQHSIVDLMRYAALNQGADDLASYAGFVPADIPNFRKPPEPRNAFERYSDEQLYALALYIYSLQAPPNPNQFGALAARGQKIFGREGCSTCHVPPFYTNNKLTPAIGFRIPEEHKSRYDILPVVVGTDPRLTMETRRGTGYYKVPSLKGVWYRSMFEHNGSVATLEDWFDARRLKGDYVPTGFKGFGIESRAVPGHEFGLKLSPEEKEALIAFLKTL